MRKRPKCLRKQRLGVGQGGRVGGRTPNTDSVIMKLGECGLSLLRISKILHLKKKHLLLKISYPH